MVILDTDHLSIFDQDTMEGFNLGRRLAVLPEEEVAVTIITYEEQMRGWLAYVARANTPDRQIEAYRKLWFYKDVMSAYSERAKRCRSESPAFE